MTPEPPGPPPAGPRFNKPADAQNVTTKGPPIRNQGLTELGCRAINAPVKPASSMDPQKLKLGFTLSLSPKLATGASRFTCDQGRGVALEPGNHLSNVW